MVDSVRATGHQRIVGLSKEGIGFVQHFVMIFFRSPFHGKLHLESPTVNLPIPYSITAMGKGPGLELAPEGIAAAVRKTPMDRQLIFHPVFGDGQPLLSFFSFRKFHVMHLSVPPAQHR